MSSLAIVSSAAPSFGFHWSELKQEQFLFLGKSVTALKKPDALRRRGRGPGDKRFPPQCCAWNLVFNVHPRGWPRVLSAHPRRTRSEAGTEDGLWGR